MPHIGFARLIVSATTPFTRNDRPLLGQDAPAALCQRAPRYESVYADRGWRMLERLDRVYVNDRARAMLGWEPRHDFHLALDRLVAGEDPRSALALAVGAEGYHAEPFGIYTTPEARVG